MRLKAGVKITGIKPELLIGLQILDRIFLNTANEDMVITSVVDGKHGRGSLHLAGMAADLRSRNLTEGQKQEILQKGKEALGEDFDFILESNHFHLEHQRKV